MFSLSFSLEEDDLSEEMGLGVIREIPHFPLEKRLLYGSLPHIYLSEEPLEELKAYITNYLILEIQTEGLVRKLPNFHNFLKGAPLSDIQILNFSKIGNDYDLPARSVCNYYEILEDLLVFP